MSSLKRFMVSWEEEVKCNEGSDQKFVLDYGTFQMLMRHLRRDDVSAVRSTVSGIITGMSGDRAENETKDGALGASRFRS